MLLDRLGGGLYKDETEASTVVFEKDFIVTDESGRASLKPTNGTAKAAQVKAAVGPSQSPSPWS